MFLLLEKLAFICLKVFEKVQILFCKMKSIRFLLVSFNITSVVYYNILEGTAILFKKNNLLKALKSFFS